MIRIGNKIEGIKYRKRLGAYVIIEHKEAHKVAIATVDGDYFLLGGGIEESETEIEALKRELIEESGYTIKNIRYFDKVSSWTKGKKKGPLDITATIYIAEFDQKITEPIEKDHKVFWVNAKEYQNKLYHEYQRYILEEYIKVKEKSKNDE